ncbi:hypothetical protein HK105_206353 [Polyrhizophydium stewartii]|uniref:Ankyrin repeat protein n=1 Tax=Polyrhizophydium stewartii TaxID=2732419 RepID=A0ABR4N3K5_9FUNG
MDLVWGLPYELRRQIYAAAGPLTEYLHDELDLPVSEPVFRRIVADCFKLGQHRAAASLAHASVGWERLLVSTPELRAAADAFPPPRGMRLLPGPLALHNACQMPLTAPAAPAASGSQGGTPVLAGGVGGGVGGGGGSSDDNDDEASPGGRAITAALRPTAFAGSVTAETSALADFVGLIAALDPSLVATANTVLEWVRTHAPPDPDADPVYTAAFLDCAAGLGRTDMAQEHMPFVRRHHAFPNVFDFAGLNGHLAAIRSFCEHGYDRKVSIDGALAGGHLHIVQYLRKKYPLLRPAIYGVVRALAAGHTDALMWLLRDQRLWACEAFRHIREACVRFGRIAVLETATALGIGDPLPACTLDIAAASGRMEMVAWLVKHDPQLVFTHRAADGAARGGHAGMLRWLRETHPDAAQCSARTVRLAAANGHIEVFLYLVREVGIVPAVCDMHAAAFNGHFFIVDAWLRVAGIGDVQPGRDLTCLMLNALAGGHAFLAERIRATGAVHAAAAPCAAACAARSRNAECIELVRGMNASTQIQA